MRRRIALKYYRGDPGELVRVEENKCNGCGDCARFCPRGVWVRDGEIFRPQKPTLCAECGACWNVCSADAVVMGEPRGGTGVRFTMG